MEIHVTDTKIEVKDCSREYLLYWGTYLSEMGKLAIRENIKKKLKRKEARLKNESLLAADSSTNTRMPK